MKLITTGETRWVMLIGKYAIKFPRANRGTRQFILGCLANLNERWFSRVADRHNDRRLARTYFSMPFGVIAIAERITGPLMTRCLTPEEAFSLPLMEFNGECGVDDHGGNTAYREDGSIVVLDYGHPGVMYEYDGPRFHLGAPRPSKR